MMKFRLSVLAVMLMAVLFSFSSCDNDDDNYLPPNPDIITMLHQLYPTVQNIEWSQKGVYYVADCWVDGSELDVWFDANANWVMTETEIFREQVPAAVNTAFQEGNYANWVIDDLTRLTFPQKTEIIVFEVQLGGQERALYYSVFGGLLHEKDITNADDTHWPDITGIPK